MKYFSSKFYYANYDILKRCIQLTIRERKVRLWFALICFLVAYFLHQSLLIFFRLVDEIFYSDYKKVQVRSPVFVIANPRSGTTYLQRLICLDDTHYTYMRFIDTLFPSVSFHKLVRAVNTFDQTHGKHIHSILMKLDGVIFKGWDDIHPMGFTEAEEDENLFVLSLMSPGIFIFFPFLDQITENQILDSCTPIVRERMMDFYEDSLKRFIFATGKDKTYLTKNVMSSGRIHSILDRFPDAKFIYIARSPYEALPSFVSMFTSMYNIHSPSLPYHNSAYEAWAKLGIEFYLHTLHLEKELPGHSFYSLRYEDLLQSPTQTVLAIFDFFQWTPSGKHLSLLSQEKTRQKGYQSKHNYSLEKYNLKRNEIHETLNEVFQKYNFRT